jgi:hypothetical protein
MGYTTIDSFTLSVQRHTAETRFHSTLPLQWGIDLTLGPNYNNALTDIK